MKNFVFLVIGILLSVNLFAQSNENLTIPQAVKNGMLANFPQTQKVPVTWSKEGDLYKGTLMVMDKPGIVVFNESGKIVRMEMRLHSAYLPQNIKDKLSKQFPGYEILDIYELTDINGKKTYRTSYQFKQTSLFNEDGEIVK